MYGHSASSNNKRKFGAEEAGSVEPGRDRRQTSLHSCNGSLTEQYESAKRVCLDQGATQSDFGPTCSPGGLSPALTPQQSASACLQMGFQHQPAWPVPQSSFDTPYTGSLTPATSAVGTSDCHSDQTMQSANLPGRQPGGAELAASSALARSNSAPDMRLMLGGFSGQTLPSMQSLPPFSSASTANALGPYLAQEGNKLF